MITGNKSNRKYRSYEVRSIDIIVQRWVDLYVDVFDGDFAIFIV